MNIRLIGLGDVGHEVVAACAQYFQTKQIVSLLESKKVVKFTTKEYSETLNNLRGATNNAEAATCGVSCSSPEALRSLRRALAYLFFGGSDDEFEQRGHELLEADAADLNVSDAGRPHVEFMQGLYANLAKVPGLRNTFRTHVNTGIFAHQAFLRAQEPLLGKDWLITPDLPVEEAGLKSRFSSIGQEMMRRVLKSKYNKRERLTKGLGLVSAEVPVDVVAIAFSVGDSFGGSGADELALGIREILQELNHNRIVALIGLAVYERNVDVLDGRYVGDYLRINRECNGFDGLIARSRVPEAIQGFGPILATIAMASDPRVIQIDNPDANQLQRDFGKSLVSCGHGQSPTHGEGLAQPQLLTLYNHAKADLFKHHAHQTSFDMLKVFQDMVKEIRQAVPTWKPPRWVERLLANPYQVGTIECETARKVVAYVGYDDTMHGNQINQMREALAHDFPRARTVVYKYRVGDVVMWAGKPLSMPSPPVPPAPAGTEETAASGQVVPGTAVSGAAALGGKGVPGVRPNPPVVPGLPLLVAPSGLQSHVALFVIDSLETVALERFCDFVLNHITVRHRDGRSLSWHGGDALLIKTIILRLLARSLLSIPAVGKEWSPPFADSARSRYLSCPRDTILGEVSEDFVRLLRAAVEEVVVGETLEASAMQSEVAKVYETVNTEQMPLLRKARLHRLEAKDVAEVLSGLNWLCNEELEKRMVTCSLWEAINQESSKPIDSYY